MTHLSLRERARLRFHGDRAPSLEEQIAEPKPIEVEQPKSKRQRAPKPLITGPTDAPVAEREYPPVQCGECGVYFSRKGRGFAPSYCPTCRKERERIRLREYEKVRVRDKRVKYAPMPCVICGTVFTPGSKATVCCSPECKHIRHRHQIGAHGGKRDRSGEKGTYHKTCPICAKAYVTKSRFQVCCSLACRSAKRQRDKAERAPEMGVTNPS